MATNETTYPSILYRKTKGSLVISDRGLFFRAEGELNAAPRVVLPWNQLVKHQVSPATHPKSLLKAIANNSNAAADKSSTSYTFAFPNRASLEGARRDITARLKKGKAPVAPTAGKQQKKRPRPRASLSTTNEELPHKRQSSPSSAHYISHDPLALIATRSSLLASDPALRAQHRLLVLDGGTLSEEDFWETHSRLVANEYAKISGKTNKGMSSDMKSSLDLGISTTSKGGAKKGGAKPGGGGGRGGIVHLGVEEMRQIFIMYPAVHRAYEEKVPLELSEEQFWRKYLESEYFHRDRGRIGAHIGKVNERELLEQERIFGKRKEDEDDDKSGKNDDKNKEEETMGDDEAKSRLAAAGTDDIFSRYEVGAPGVHRKRHGGHRHHHNRKLGVQLAVGQFDLASTNEVERGDRFLELKDLHPPPEKDSAGALVIDKYNRHWAIVLHPTESTAGVDLGHVAAKSARESATIQSDDEDAKVNGGYDREMRRLIGFADANENDADYARGVGDEEEELMELHLRNIDAYSGKFGSDKTSNRPGLDLQTRLKFAKYLAAHMRGDTEPILQQKTAGKAKGFCHAPTLKEPFLPNPRVGRGLMEALTKKMAADSQTDADVQMLAETMSAEFKNQLATFFRRASELLRHFFSLRSVFNENSDGNGGVGQSEVQKDRLVNIVKGMEKVRVGSHWSILYVHPVGVHLTSLKSIFRSKRSGAWRDGRASTKLW